MEIPMIQSLLQEMFSYYADDPARIQHFMKVWGFSLYIGRAEGLSQDQLFLLETAAIIHDIGIKPAEEKYENCSGPLQEVEGPPAARQMLTALGFPGQVVERVCYLVGHHHTYREIRGMDYQILVEADFLVNLFEEHAGKEAVQTALDTIFLTSAGSALCKEMFGLNETEWRSYER